MWNQRAEDRKQQRQSSKEIKSELETHVHEEGKVFPESRKLIDDDELAKLGEVLGNGKTQTARRAEAQVKGG